MHFYTLLATALLPAALISAAPGASLDSEIFERTSTCPGNQKWCGWKDSCQCTNYHPWDSKNKKCHYPPIPQPSCPKGQKPYCAKSQNEYCPWDSGNDYCYDNGQNQAGCCEPDKVKPWAQKKCPNPKSCSSDQVYNYSSGQCQCKKGKQWKNGKCMYPPMPKPSCPNGQNPCCANTNKDWTRYDSSASQCADNGLHTTFCSKPGKEQQWCDSHWSS